MWAGSNHITISVNTRDRRITTQLANMSFDKIFDLTAGVYFYFYNNNILVREAEGAAVEMGTRHIPYQIPTTTVAVHQYTKH